MDLTVVMDWTAVSATPGMNLTGNEDMDLTVLMGLIVRRLERGHR
jgi:hypothetical protein